MKIHDQKLNRRSFLRKIVNFFGGIPFLSLSNEILLKLGKSNLSLENPIHIYADESGKFGFDKYFVLGLLLTNNPQRHEKYVEKMRKRHNFWTELRYCSTDKFKLPFVKDLIQYFFEEPDMRFIARLVSDENMPPVEKSKRILKRVYYLHYKKLIQDGISASERKVLHLEKRTKTGEHRLLNEYLIKNVNRVHQIEIIKSYKNKNNLIQFADVLTGSIFGDATGVDNSVKVDLIDILKKKLKVDKLYDVKLDSKNFDFRVTIG